MALITPYDRDTLRAEFQAAKPFPYIALDPFLDTDFAASCAQAVPSFEEAQELGLEFSAVNEKKKIQITDSSQFPAPIAELHKELSSEAWLKDLEYITGIPNLLSDAKLGGGGIHVTGPRGRLDVHVDFNYIESQQLHRRLNILVYLNPEWKPEWGGAVELWDKDVTQCQASFTPKLNRCVIFETSEISFHGVTPVTCPKDRTRQSFASYYYTKEAPAGWTGDKHTTIFRSRPDEKFREAVLVPGEQLKRNLQAKIKEGKGHIKRLIGRK